MVEMVAMFDRDKEMRQDGCDVGNAVATSNPL